MRSFSRESKSAEVVTREVYEELLYCGNKKAYSAEMVHVGEDMDGIDALKGSIYGARRCEDGGNTVEDILIGSSD